MIRTDLAGKKLWGSSHDGTYMATDGKRLFLAGGYGFDRSPAIKVLAIEDGRAADLRQRQPRSSPRRRAAARKTTRSPALACDGKTLFVAYGNGT